MTTLAYACKLALACVVASSGVACDEASQASPDASTPPMEAGTPVDAPAMDEDAAPSMDKVAMFVAQGPLGRTIVSCDDGQTWVGNHSWDLDGDDLLCGMVQPGMICGQTTCSYLFSTGCMQRTCCSDAPDAPQGIAFGDGSLLSAWGHGSPGAIRRSTNGIDWTRALGPVAPTPVAYGGGRFVIAAFVSYPYARWSTDGSNWTDGGRLNTPNRGGFRSLHYTDYGGGRFIGFSSNGGVGEPANTTRYVVLSSDGGETWTIASGLPSECANGVGGGFVVGARLLLIGDEHGTVCTSSDGGETWTVTATGQQTVAASVSGGGGAIWTGTDFRFWGAGNMTRSTDGAAWTTSMLVGTPRVGSVARSDNGTFVGVVGEYQNQKFLVSSDGVTWQTLPTSSFFQSHRIAHITFGYAEPSALCPLR